MMIVYVTLCLSLCYVVHQRLVSFSARYHISGIFRLGLIFAEFVTSLKSPKLQRKINPTICLLFAKITAKNKPQYMSSLRVFEIAKIELIENLIHLPSVIFTKFYDAKNSRYTELK